MGCHGRAGSGLHQEGPHSAAAPQLTRGGVETGCTTGKHISGLGLGCATSQTAPRAAPCPEPWAVSLNPSSDSHSDPSPDQQRQLQEESQREWLEWGCGGGLRRDKTDEWKRKGRRRTGVETHHPTSGTGLRAPGGLLQSGQPWGRGLRRWEGVGSLHQALMLVSDPADRLSTHPGGV